MIHNYSGNPYNMADITNLHKEGPQRGYVTVFAQAIYGWRIASSWNAGTCCGKAVTSNIKDV